MRHFHPEDRLFIVWAMIVIGLLAVLGVVFFLYGQLAPTTVRVSLITFIMVVLSAGISYHIGYSGFIANMMIAETYEDDMGAILSDLVEPSQEIIAPTNTTLSSIVGQPFYGLRDHDGSPIPALLGAV